MEFCYRQTDKKAREQEQKNPAFENIAIRIIIWELIEFESVHLTSNRIKSNVILQSRAHNQESGTKFEKSLPFTNCYYSSHSKHKAGVKLKNIVGPA